MGVMYNLTTYCFHNFINLMSPLSISKKYRTKVAKISNYIVSIK